MTEDDIYRECATDNAKLREQIKQLQAELTQKDELVFAYESVNAPVNPLAEENQRLKEEYKKEVTRLEGKIRQCCNTMKKVYRKYYLSDDDIGSEELGHEMCDALCEMMGDKSYQEWLSDIDFEKGQDNET